MGTAFENTALRLSQPSPFPCLGDLPRRRPECQFILRGTASLPYSDGSDALIRSFTRSFIEQILVGCLLCGRAVPGRERQPTLTKLAFQCGAGEGL